MLSLLVAATLAVQQPPSPPSQDTTKRDTTKVKLDSLPLKTTRTVSFETSEGTWISLDVSPDGKYIVVSRTSGVLGSVYELWLIHKDGGSGAAMLRVQAGPNQPPPMNTLGAAFGKDPRYVWVSRHRGGFGYDLQYPLWQLAIYDRQQGRTFLQTDLYGSAMRPVLSSDGKWLVYPVTRDDEESRFTRDLYPGFSFTPDNQAIIVSYGGKIHRVAVPSGQVTDIPFTAKV